MIVEVYTGLTDLETTQLTSQGIDLDDWDHLFVVDERFVEGREPTAEDSSRYNAGELLTKLLSCGYRLDTVWYKATFRGNLRGIGIAYHA